MQIIDFAEAANIGTELANSKLEQQASETLGVLRTIRDGCPMEWDAITQSQHGAELLNLWDRLRQQSRGTESAGS